MKLFILCVVSAVVVTVTGLFLIVHSNSIGVPTLEKNISEGIGAILMTPFNLSSAVSNFFFDKKLQISWLNIFTFQIAPIFIVFYCCIGLVIFYRKKHNH